MALVLPVTFLFIFGLFYFCVALFNYEGCVLGTRAAARFAALHSSTSVAPATSATIQTVAQAYTILPTGGTSQVTTTYSPASSNVIGNTVVVSMSMTLPSFIPFAQIATVSVGSSAQRTITR